MKIISILILFICFLTSPALAEKRVALVIGNDDYDELPQLRNAFSDAKAMASTLRTLGFDVLLDVNTSRVSMHRAIKAFKNQAKNSDLALIFYAGHGITVDKKNYLIPVDSKIKYEDDLRLEAIEQELILQAMEDTQASVKILILDACRDNPLAGATRSASRGLTVETVGKLPSGTAIIYSASENEKALDGEPGGNSIFTQQLISALSDRKNLIDVFNHVLSNVQSASYYAQTPFLVNEITNYENVYLNNNGLLSGIFSSNQGKIYFRGQFLTSLDDLTKIKLQLSKNISEEPLENFIHEIITQNEYETRKFFGGRLFVRITDIYSHHQGSDSSQACKFLIYDGNSRINLYSLHRGENDMNQLDFFNVKILVHDFSHDEQDERIHNCIYEFWAERK